MKKHPLHHFEIFLLVTQLKSFTAAAKVLGVSKAAVSQTIKSLEQSLQTPLLIRTTRSLSLTEEGVLLQQQCEKIKSELDVAHHLMQGFHQEPSGLLRISCNPYYHNQQLIQLIADYQQRYPQVNIDLIVEERMPDMKQENIDIVFAVNWPAPLDCVARIIGETRYILCASPQYLAKHGTPTTLQALKNHMYIPHSGRDANNVIAQLRDPVIPPFASKLAMNDANMMRLAAINHMGIIQLHDYMVQQELADGTLVEILKNTIHPATPLYIYYQKHRYVQPKIKTFVSMLLQQYNSA